MEFKELMQGFAERTGAEDSFLLDEDGVYRIGIDGFEVAFMDVPEKDSLLMWCDLGEMPHDEGDQQVLRLLRENFVGRGGCVLSLDDSGHVFAHRYVSLGGIDLDGFLNGPLEDFLGLLPRWAATSNGAEADCNL